VLYKILDNLITYLLRCEFSKISIFGAIRADPLGSVTRSVVNYVRLTAMLCKQYQRLQSSTLRSSLVFKTRCCKDAIVQLRGLFIASPTEYSLNVITLVELLLDTVHAAKNGSCQ